MPRNSDDSVHRQRCVGTRDPALARSRGAHHSAYGSTGYSNFIGDGGVLAVYALVTALVTRLRRDDEPLTTFVTPAVLNDLGNLLISALLMWAYMAFSQYLVIWTGNLSEEIPWYLKRLDGGWQVL